MEELLTAIVNHWLACLVLFMCLLVLIDAIKK
jgi:hypothetical protein